MLQNNILYNITLLMQMFYNIALFLKNVLGQAYWFSRPEKNVFNGTEFQNKR